MLAWQPPLSARSAHHMNMAVQQLQMPVRGMTCANCARSVERTLAATPGVSKVIVDLPGACARVTYDSDRVTPEALAGAVRDIGYEVPA